LPERHRQTEVQLFIETISGGNLAFIPSDKASQSASFSPGRIGLKQTAPLVTLA